MKKKVLSIMMAVAMTLSVTAFATAVTAVNNTTVTFADTTSSVNLRVDATNILFPNNEYEGRACVGDTVKINATASGNVKYDMHVSKRNGMGTGNESYTNLNSGTNLSWTPQSTGLYQIDITATNVDTNVSETKYLHFSVSEKLSIDELAVENLNTATRYDNIYSGKEISVNSREEIAISAKSIGGAGQVVYNYKVTPRQGQYHSSYSYVSTDGNFKFIAPYSDLYGVTIEAKDQLGHTSTKYLYFSVTQ